MTEFEVLGNRFASGMSVDLTVRARLNGAPPARVPNFVVSCFNFGSINRAPTIGNKGVWPLHPHLTERTNQSSLAVSPLLTVSEMNHFRKLIFFRKNIVFIVLQ